MPALQVILNILGLISAGATDFTALESKVQGMVQTGTDPTDEQWDELLDDIDAESAKLAAADKEA